MNRLPPSASTLFAGIDDSAWPRLLAGIPRLLADSVHTDLPDALVDHVLDTGDPTLLADLAANQPVLRRRPDVADRLAVVLDPAAALRELWTTRNWEYRHWETLLRGWSPDEAELENRERSGVAFERDLGSCLVHSPLPEHQRALRRHAYPTEREQVRALAWRLRHGEVEPDGCDPAVVERVKAALAEPGGVEALLAEVDGTEAVLAELRGKDPTDVQHRAELDWTAIAAAHIAEPFGSEAAAALTQRGDCPEELRLTLFTAHPEQVAQSASSPHTLFAAHGTGPAHAKGRLKLIERVHESGRIAELVAHGRPAAAVLETARTSREDKLHPEHWGLTAVHTAVRPILDRTVGTDPAAWRSLRRLLGKHDGTVAELCAKAAASPDTRDRWPDAKPLPGIGHKPAPIRTRKAFLVLLDAAGPQTHFALLPHLDPRTLHDLFVHGVYRSEWFGHLVEHGTPGQRLAFAHSHMRLNPEQVQRLLDLGEPELATALFERQHMTVAQIEQVLGAPVPSDFKDRLLAREYGWHGRHAIAAAELELRRHIAGHAPVVGEVPQLRLLLNVWENDGRDAMLDFRTAQTFDDAVTERVAGLADPGDLRAHLAERETPEWQIARLLDDADFHLEHHDWFFPEIVEALHLTDDAHDREDFEGLRTTPGSPLGPLYDRFAGRELVALDKGATVAELCAGEPVDPNLAYTWIETAIGSGRAAWTELLRHGHPVQAVLTRARKAHPLDLDPALREVIAEANPTPEALLLALGLLDDFPGTLPELLATANAATR